MHTIVVGAGWAGLSCAYELTQAGHKVTLIEAAPQCGGRARSVNWGNQLIDNGQHVMVGAYHTLRALIKKLGLNEQQLFKIFPLELIVHGKVKFKFKLPDIPAPFNLLLGIWGYSNLPWREKLNLSKFCYGVNMSSFALKEDCSVLDLLQNYQQSAYLIDYLWQPLCLAIMTTPADQASAQVFLRVLQNVFLGANQNSHWYLPRIDLSKILPAHLEAAIKKNNGSIIFNHTIQKLVLQDRKCMAIASRKQTWQADQIILATPFNQTHDLLQEHAEFHHTTKALGSLSFEPITTIYFLFAKPITTTYPIFGMINTISQWVVSKDFAGQENIICVVISGKINADYNTPVNLCQAIYQELRRYIPDLPSPVQHKVIQEKRAAFNCNVAAHSLRPTAKTEVANVWLTGDYVQTGLPATLEGALISGMETARELLGISPRSNQNC